MNPTASPLPTLDVRSRERATFRDHELGDDCYLVVCSVGPGDRRTTVRVVRSGSLVPLVGRVDRSERDIATIKLPMTKADICEKFLPFDFPQEVFRRLSKDIRRASVAALEKTWEETLPPEIVTWATDRLAASAKDEPCVDNWRVARTGVSSQVRRYRRQQAAGCCGSEDFTAVGPDGHLYMLGFNYGH